MTKNSFNPLSTAGENTPTDYFDFVRQEVAAPGDPATESPRSDIDLHGDPDAFDFDFT